MESTRKTLRGELALVVIVFINSFGVVLMLHSGSGISAISSVPYAFSEVLPKLSLGTWTYLFQACLVATLFLLRRKLVPEYLFSFVVGFFFGNVVDLHQLWVSKLPYSKIKIPFDVICLAVTAVLTGVFLGHIKGLGIGTVLAAFTMGKVIGWMGEQMDKHVVFTSVLAQHRAKLAHSASH